MPWIQPAPIYFEADPATASLLQTALTQRGRRLLNFRGHEERRVRGNPAPPPPEPGPVQTYTVAVQSDADLIAAGQALAAAGVKAWLTVASPQGPQAMELGEYLRQRGLV